MGSCCIAWSLSLFFLFLSYFLLFLFSVWVQSTGASCVNWFAWFVKHRSSGESLSALAIVYSPFVVFLFLSHLSFLGPPSSIYCFYPFFWRIRDDGCEDVIGTGYFVSRYCFLRCGNCACYLFLHRHELSFTFPSNLAGRGVSSPDPTFSAAGIT